MPTFQQDSDSGYVSNCPPNEIPSRIVYSANDLAKSPSETSTSIGSLEDLDKVEYDVNRDDHSRAVGVLGKCSEITWMRGLEQEIKEHAIAEEETSEGQLGDDTSIRPLPHELNYHLDDLDVGVSEPVQLYEMPPRPLADALFSIYMRVVDPYLPIVNRPLFSDQYRRFSDKLGVPGDKWLAILNLMLAIAAVYAQVAELDHHGGPQDHLLYFTRARMLSMGGDNVFAHPDLQQVQVEGLTAFYLLTTDQIHRQAKTTRLDTSVNVRKLIHCKGRGAYQQLQSALRCLLAST